MSIQAQFAKKSAQQLVVGAAPGVYVSEKGSIAILTENNVYTSGKEYTGPPQGIVTVIDVDSKKSFLKDITKLKGKYTYQFPLSELVLTRKS